MVFSWELRKHQKKKFHICKKNLKKIFCQWNQDLHREETRNQPTTPRMSTRHIAKIMAKTNSQFGWQLNTNKKVGWGIRKF